MEATTGSVSSVTLRALIAACNDLGIDASELLEDSGLRAQDLEDSDRRFPLHVAGALWVEAERRTGNTAIALLAADALPMGAYKIGDYLMAHSPSVGEGLRRLAGYFALIADSIAINITEHEQTRLLELQSKTRPGGPPPRFAELTLASIVVRARKAWQIDWAPSRVEFRFAEPPHAAEHLRIFRCPVVFASERDALVIDEKTWNAAVPRSDPFLLQVLDDHARRLLQELPACGDLIGAAREGICRALDGGEVSVHAVATEMGMSSRSLQRRLQEHQTTFAAVYEEVRCELAKFHLSQRESSIIEIAYLLGFADQSAFQRAFKRWTRTTPRRFREETSALA